jgi:hypothetical protein
MLWQDDALKRGCIYSTNRLFTSEFPKFEKRLVWRMRIAVRSEMWMTKLRIRILWCGSRTAHSLKMRIWIRRFILMRLRIRLLCKVTRMCNHKSTRLHGEPARPYCPVQKSLHGFLLTLWAFAAPSFTFMRIRIRLFTKMQIRIRLLTMMAWYLASQKNADP